MSAAQHIAPARAPLRGQCCVPTDKSISHRALIFAGLASGQARVRGLLDSVDVRSSLRCMQMLGLGIRWNTAELVITGMGGRLTEPQGILDCGNSGTTMRLLCGLLAGHDVHSVLTGDASLRRRPMARVCDPLRKLGARLDGRQSGRMAPLSIRGKRPLSGGRIVSPIASAQVKSALLLAGLQAEGSLTVSQPGPSRDHSERLLAAMGADLHQLVDPGGTYQVTISAGAHLHMVDIDIPGDISSAAFLLVAAALVPGSLLELDQVGVNTSRSGILDILDAMGAGAARENGRVVGGEARATLIASSADLHGTRIAGALVPRLIDEIPVLAVAAAFAEGTTTFADAAELRHKESDRVACTVAMLRAFGAQAEELPDGLIVHGSGGAMLRGGTVAARGDHRIAMAAAVAGLRCRDGVDIVGADVVDVSFPGFFRILESLRA